MNIYILPTLVTLLPSNGLPIAYQDYNIAFDVEYDITYNILNYI